MSTDPLHEVLAAMQKERLKLHPTNEAFRTAKLNYASFLEKDHAGFYKKKAEKYKQGTIQYNKNMARYNELIEEITELRREAAEGKTTNEMRIEAAIKQRIDDEREEEERQVKKDALKLQSTEELKVLAHQHNIIWGDKNLSWPARYRGKNKVKDIITILKDRGIDIIPDLDAQLHKMEAAV